jgi:hypothetical protein
VARRPRALCTIDEVKRLLPNYQEPADPTEKTVADTLLADWIDSASQRIYDVSGREILAYNDPGTVGNNDWPAPADATREFEVVLNPQTPTDPNVGTKRARSLMVGDLASLTSIQYGDPWAPASRFMIDPAAVRARPLVRAPWQPIRRLEILGDAWADQSYYVAGKWGFPVVPMDIREACQEQVAIWTGRDLTTFSRTFLEAAAAGGAATEPRHLARSVYDVAYSYYIPDVV